MFQLGEEQRLIIQSVREIVQKEIKPRAVSLDENGDFPWDAVRIFSKNDLLNPLLPRKFGGVEISYFTFCMIVEEIAKACASSSDLLIAQAEGMLPILRGTNKALEEKYLKRLAGSSQVLIALGGIDPSAGSGILSLEAKAIPQGKNYILQAERCFIKNGSVAEFVVVYANTNPSKGGHELEAFVVEKGFPGLVYGRNENKMGMRGIIRSEVLLRNCEVPNENRIGEEGEGLSNMMRILSLSRLFTAAQAVGLAQGAMEEAISYARHRVQFGKPISHSAPIQFMIADMAAGIESAKLLTYKTAFLFDEGNQKAQTHACMAKLLASDVAMKVTTDTVQIMGGYGYMKDYPAERMMRDAKQLQIQSGTNQIMKLAVGRDLTGVSE
jgi:alkylation response protein AidB-like acyl-CoA dehydrogenase